jgi:hypothetical protein
MSISDVTSKILKLFAKAESTDNPNEAAAFIAGAQRMMAKHSIAEAELELAGAIDHAEPVEDPEPLEETGRVWKTAISCAIVEANSCTVYHRGYRKVVGGMRASRATTRVHIIGTKSNLEKVRFLYGYCCDAVDRLANKQAGRGRNWIYSYRIGCADAIVSAIRFEMDFIRDEYEGTSALIVVDTQKEDAEAFLRANHDLKSATARDLDIDPRAMAEGKRDGQDIYPGSGTAIDARNSKEITA